MQILVLLCHTVNLSDSCQITIHNNILMLKFINDGICIHISDETLSEVIKDLFSCIYEKRRVVLHKTANITTSPTLRRCVYTRGYM